MEVVINLSVILHMEVEILIAVAQQTHLQIHQVDAHVITDTPSIQLKQRVYILVHTIIPLQLLLLAHSIHTQMAHHVPVTMATQ